MNEDTKVFEASSPEALRNHLAEFNQGPGSCTAALSVKDPKVIVRQFQLDNVSLKDLGHHLLSEAVELMSLPSDEIVLDFQVTASKNHVVKGIYVCIAKGLLEEYLGAFDKRDINLMRLTEQFLVSIDLLYQNDKLDGKRICFLDFSTNNIINLFISSNEECELLRKIHYENFDEVRKEILRSLRSASAKSRSKHYDIIYYHGAFEHMEELMAALKKSFSARIKELVDMDRKTALCGDKRYFSLNLLRNHMFSPAQLSGIRTAINLVLAVGLFSLAVLSFQITKKNKMIGELTSQDSQYPNSGEPIGADR